MLALPDDFDTWSLERKNLFLDNLKYTWEYWARPEQLLPNLETKWNVWMILSGRGWGKTRTGAEAIKKLMLAEPNVRVGIIGMTAAAVRDTCYEGEALDVTTEILTDRGWTTMEDVHVGDRVYAADGTLTRVQWVSDIYTDRPCYNVSFADGSVISADAQHKWLVRTEQAGYRTQTTDEMARLGVKRGKVWHWMVNEPVALSGTEVEPFVDPYCLGYWLGDGTSKNGNITTMDHEVVEEFNRVGFITRAYAWGTKGQAQTYGVYGFQAKLRERDLLRNKHVPEDVWSWSLSDRIRFVQGLMDSDGDVTERGQCCFNNTNYRLITGLRSILSSIGVRVSEPKHHTKAKISVSDSWRLSFTTDIPVAHVQRKAERLTGDVRTRDRAITDISKTTSVPVRCISVEHESHVFLVGRSFIPTHNSGLLSVIPSEMYDKKNGGVYNRSLGQLTLSNGSRAFSFSGADPEKLRGFQSNYLWMDELCAFQYAQETWDMSMMGLRLGKHPRIIITTTPKPSPLIVELVRRGQTGNGEGVVLTTGSTFDNSANLPETQLEELRKRYEGTTMGRQELYAELILDDPGALWKREVIEDGRIDPHAFKLADMVEIVVAIDPSMSALGEHDSETGMIVAGKGANGHCYIIEDCSLMRPSPDTWSKLAIAKYHEYSANKIVAEVNQGYDLVANLLGTQDDTVPLKKVYATRGGKYLRAEPVAALYEQKRVHHVGMHSKLEDQMTQWVPGKPSPDRLDAMVWAVTQLMLGGGVAEFFSPIALPKLPGLF